MKQFDRTAWEQYRRNPRGNNILYQNYSNPSAEGQYSPIQMQEPVPNQPQSPLQKPPQEIQERWPQDATYRNLLPPSMQGYNSNQILQELQKSYQANQNLPEQRNAFMSDIGNRRLGMEQQATNELNTAKTAATQREDTINNAINSYVTTMQRLRMQGGNFYKNPDLVRAQNTIDQYLTRAEADKRVSPSGFGYPAFFK